MPAPRPDNLDPDLLPVLPVLPVSVRIDFVDGTSPGRHWLVLSWAGAVAQDNDLGIPLTLRLACTLVALAGVWLGHVTWLDALRAGSVRVTGDRDAVSTIIGWLGVSRVQAASRPRPALRPAEPATSPNGAGPPASPATDG